MTFQCRKCESPYDLSNWEIALLERVSPRFEQLHRIPPPTLCPECRQQRRLSFNNEVKLYQRSCDKTGAPLISVYPPDSPYTIYKPEVWWSDAWDPLSYGRPYNFNRSFFEQFDELLRAVPRVALHTNYLLDENSDYTNYAGSNKNCYLIFHADFNRDCYYGYGVKKCESCVDVYNVFDSELCYECTDCHHAYNLRYSEDCENCSDSYFLNHCIGCKNCIACKNLHQKQYCIFNEQYSREDYERFLNDAQLHTRSGVAALREKYEAFCKTLPVRALRMFHCEESAGDGLVDCKNVKNSFNVADMRDASNCYQIYNGAHDCMDLYQFGLNAELIYDCSIVGYNANRLAFCHLCNEQVHDLYYCQNCHHASYLFGCIGVRNKQYCVLNTQYSEAEYKKLVPRVIESMQERKEWGEFFPGSLSPFGYNQTTAIDYFPLKQEAAAKDNWKWYDEKEGMNTPVATSLPDSIHDFSDDISQKTLKSSLSGKPYKVIPPELLFYKKWNVPVPERAPDERYRARLQKRRPRKLQSATCGNCKTSVLTTARNGENVLCESCFQREMFG